MVDYLKIRESIEADSLILSSFKEIYTDQDYMKLFNILDRHLKFALISMKALVDGLEKVVDKIEEDEKISVYEKMESILLISDITNQIHDTVIGIDCNVVKKSWEYTGNPADDLKKIKTGEL